MLVIGSRNSSNSNRLVEVTRELGVPAHLIDDETASTRPGSTASTTVGITSGASAPETLVERVIDHFRAMGVERVEAQELVNENVHFSLPLELRRAVG